MQATFRRSAPMDVAFAVESKEGARLKAINVNGKKINKTGNYTNINDVVTLNTEYVETLESKESVITFIMEDGSVLEASLIVED